MSGYRKIGVLISGRGSNLAALIEACQTPDYPAEIAVVISNRPGAPGLQFAESAGIPTQVIDHKHFASRTDFDRALDDALRAAGAELVCNAGFMRLLTPEFVQLWRDRQLNIHPSLLPAFRGLDTHERAIASGVRISGCTVHFVRAEMDEGPIVAQAAVPVLPGDDAEALAARVLRAEHQLYPWAVRLVASGAAWVEDDRVVYAPDVPQPEGVTLFAPLPGH
ncbi:phosphoribosylglycinamide formyltransferase [Dichotomicrobium thermohalophilum]|uniref:Phosphoribosylglycinamide formyltransferase n=1 Tax=Dichotomicrobium thermohalophilum TaxID=933063 RepID=A0A397Q8J8_9HYPH|nr:phosphoribosylglycinamide formyltransferase [Dichotomicrobium thermohalophilum]RIA56839.1 phosphoribosylglycinamide formyltransferase-1 [Dichotomicrobium thermohalophilum]